MKNRNSVLNSMFKDRLDDNNKLKWDKICKNYTLDLVLNLFIGGISSKERYLRDNIFISKGIVGKLKDRKNITYIKPENYRSFFTLFPLFYKFYQENWSNIQDLFCDDIYNEKKDNLKEYKDLEKIFEWQNFMEQDDSKQARDYMNKLKYLYMVFPENELIDIFKLYINSAYRLHNLSNGYEDLLKGNKPFDIVIKDLDNDIIKKIGDIGKSNIHIINSLFSRYLHVLKINKKLRNNLIVENKESKNVQNKAKKDLFDDLDSQVINIISVRTKYGGSENVDYVDGNPVAPISDFMEGDENDDI